MKLFLALPVYGGYNAHFVTCLLELVRRPPCDLMVRPLVGDSLVARARNNLAKQFLQSDCTHLLFLDTDLLFSVEHIRRLISHPACPIVCGLYPKKQRDLAWVCNVIPGEEPTETGLQKVKYAGTGCMLIERRVFEEMIGAFGTAITYQPDAGEEGEAWDFFATGPRPDAVTGAIRYHSEDWGFCQRAASLGIPIWMDTEVVLKHVGEIAFPLQAIEEFAVPG